MCDLWFSCKDNIQLFKFLDSKFQMFCNIYSSFLILAIYKSSYIVSISVSVFLEARFMKRFCAYLMMP